METLLGIAIGVIIYIPIVLLILYLGEENKNV